MKLSLHLVNFHHRRTGNSRLQAGEIHYRKLVRENKFPDRELEDLDNFFQEELGELEEEYLENDKEDEYYEIEHKSGAFSNALALSQA